MKKLTKVLAFVLLFTFVTAGFAAPAYARGRGHGHGGWGGRCCGGRGAWSVANVDADELIAQRGDFLDTLVDAGQITRQQADDDLQWYRDMLSGELADNPDAFRGFRGGRGGGCRGFAGTAAAPWCPWFSGDIGAEFGHYYGRGGCWFWQQ